jgi:hypothetical protein
MGTECGLAAIAFAAAPPEADAVLDTGAVCIPGGTTIWGIAKKALGLLKSAGLGKSEAAAAAAASAGSPTKFII